MRELSAASETTRPCHTASISSFLLTIRLRLRTRKTIRSNTCGSIGTSVPSRLSSCRARSISNPAKRNSKGCLTIAGRRRAAVSLLCDEIAKKSVMGVTRRTKNRRRRRPPVGGLLAVTLRLGRRRRSALTANAEVDALAGPASRGIGSRIVGLRAGAMGRHVMMDRAHMCHGCLALRHCVLIGESRADGYKGESRSKDNSDGGLHERTPLFGCKDCLACAPCAAPACHTQDTAELQNFSQHSRKCYGLADAAK